MRTLLLVLGCLLLGLGLLTLGRLGPVEDPMDRPTLGPRTAEAPDRQEVDLVAPSSEGRAEAGLQPEVIEIPGGAEALEAHLGRSKFRWILSGNLRNAETGQPIGESVQVSLVGATFAASRVNDAGQRYRFLPTAAGSYQLRAKAIGFAPFEGEVNLVGHPRPVVHDVYLTPQRRVLVRASTPEGVPLEDALADAKLRASGELAVTVSEVPVHERLLRAPPRRGSAPRSAYDTSLAALRSLLGNHAPIPEDALGVLSPYEPGPQRVVLAHDETVIASIDLAEDATELTFVLAVEDARSTLATVSVRLEDQLGRPILGIVSVSPFAFPFRPTPIDGDGTLRDLAAGRHYLVAEANGLETHVSELVLQPGERREVTVVLRPARTLEGQVVDEVGQGVPADVHVLHADGQLAAQGWTDHLGQFRFEGLSERDYILMLAGDGASATNGTVLDRVAPPHPFTLTADMPPLRIRSSTGATLELERRDLDPRELSFRVLGADELELRRSSLASGKSTTLRLPPGGYTVETFRRDEVIGTFGVSVGAGENRLVLQ